MCIHHRIPHCRNVRPPPTDERDTEIPPRHFPAAHTPTRRFSFGDPVSGTHAAPPAPPGDIATCDRPPARARMPPPEGGRRGPRCRPPDLRAWRGRRRRQKRPRPRPPPRRPLLRAPDREPAPAWPGRLLLFLLPRRRRGRGPGKPPRRRGQGAGAEEGRRSWGGEQKEVPRPCHPGGDGGTDLRVASTGLQKWRVGP